MMIEKMPQIRNERKSKCLSMRQIRRKLESLSDGYNAVAMDRATSLLAFLSDAARVCFGKAIIMPDEVATYNDDMTLYWNNKEYNVCVIISSNTIWFNCHSHTNKKVSGTFGTNETSLALLEWIIK
jgi:aromatic ring-opening dioxygenase LigB subunit